ncbi:MAG: hypothetical protein JOZ22_02975 [Acidobacteriia bacterium]|nr:hypothetical protein [Terriglobia bacterium]
MPPLHGKITSLLAILPKGVTALFSLPEDQTARWTGQDTPLEQRLKAMDGQGIDMEVLSINPSWYEANRDVATQ